MSLFNSKESWISYSVSEQIDSYITDCQSRQLAAGTISTYRFYLNWFQSWCDQVSLTDIRQANHQLLRHYLKSIQISKKQQMRSPYTVHVAFRVLRSFFQYLTDEELFDSNPVSKLKSPRLPKRILPALTPDEVASIIKHLTSWERKAKYERDGLDLYKLRNTALFLFLLDSGLRVQEAANLKIADLDLKSGRVFVRSGKGDKDRITFVSEETIKYVKQYLRHLEDPNISYLWVGQDKNLSSAGIQMIFKRISAETGVKLSPHKIRRTFAISMLRNGADVYRLRDLMGHADTKTLERYLDIQEPDLQQAHKIHSPVTNLARE